MIERRLTSARIEPAGDVTYLLDQEGTRIATFNTLDAWYNEMNAMLVAVAINLLVRKLDTEGVSTTKLAEVLPFPDKPEEP